ncbi:hypothetical protein B0H67DRAFT_676718 [Lasiosphaeris hirsuta]|uniref:Uncharacterized protein n=1 Tax=Lasiosphaeris hirsuta TaxID=260670 RepID=A0AA40DIC6_9PEZI|nr:hypothetical protein B0H67DRAFT_676718 [Lasiosphaeris hirsuta]
MHDKNESPKSKLEPGEPGEPGESGRKWEPGVIARFPLIGFGALGLSICCTVTAVAIVILSDGKLTTAWYGNQQPTVLLAYTSTLADALMTVAFAEAVDGGLTTSGLIPTSEPRPMMTYETSLFAFRAES